VTAAALGIVALARGIAHFRTAASGRLDQVAGRDFADPLTVGDAGSGLLWPTVFELAGAPLAVRFDYPDGSAAGAFSTPPARPGSDDPDAPGRLDWGQPAASLRAAADGLVLFAGRSPGRAGHTVVLGHRLEDGSFVQSGYDGLGPLEVALGDLVWRGDPLGLAMDAGAPGGDPPRYWFSAAPTIATSPRPPAPDLLRSHHGRPSPDVVDDHAPVPAKHPAGAAAPAIPEVRVSPVPAPGAQSPGAPGDPAAGGAQRPPG
jgi:hypothetical protein